jgi:uncharacterized protein (TIRG00374 family)
MNRPALQLTATGRGTASLARFITAGRFLPRGWMDFWRQLAVMSTFAFAYEAVRVLARGDRGTALAHASSIVETERSLGLFVELDVQRWAMSAPSWVLDVANYTYLNCQFTISFAMMLWVYLCRNDSFARLRNTIMLVDLLGVIGYLAFPAAPPRMLGDLGFVDTLNQASVNHNSGAVAALSNPYAAMPSLHTAYALVIGATVAALVRSHVLRAVWALYPALVVFSIIATGNHFVLDALAGAAVAAVAAGLAAAYPAAQRMPTSHRGNQLALLFAAAALLVFAGWRVAGHLTGLTDVLGSAAPAMLLAALGANLGSVLLKATVWKATLESTPEAGRVSYRTLVPPLFIGFLCNSIFMLRLGDVARVADARRRLQATGNNVPTTVIAGSAIAEQMMLGLALVALGLAFALVVATPPAWICISLCVVAISIAGSAFVITRAGGWRSRGHGRAARYMAAALEVLGHSRHVLRSRSAFALALVAALGSWGFQIFGIFLLLLAFGLPHGSTAVAAVFLASTCVGLVPLVPGNIGVFPVAVSAALAGLGVGVAKGASFGLALQTVEVSLGAGLGLLFAITFGGGLRDLVRRKPDLKLVVEQPALSGESSCQDRLAA